MCLVISRFLEVPGGQEELGVRSFVLYLLAMASKGQQLLLPKVKDSLLQNTPSRVQDIFASGHLSSAAIESQLALLPTKNLDS